MCCAVHKRTQELSNRQFKRLGRIKRETFDAMVKVAQRQAHLVDTTPICSGKFRLVGEYSLLRGFELPETIVMDVMENPIERSQRGQKEDTSRR